MLHAAQLVHFLVLLALLALLALLVLVSRLGRHEVLATELVQPVDTKTNTFLPGPAQPIDVAHRRAVAHKGVWLHVVTSDGAVLVLRRSASMKTCPGQLSIIGEHHKGPEADESCAQRAMHEELPALELLPPSDVRLERLRKQGRWFLYDYSDGVRRDRARSRRQSYMRSHSHSPPLPPPPPPPPPPPHACSGHRSGSDGAPLPQQAP